MENLRDSMMCNSATYGTKAIYPDPIFYKMARNPEWCSMKKALDCAYGEGSYPLALVQAEIESKGGKSKIYESLVKLYGAADARAKTFLRINILGVE